MSRGPGTIERAIQAAFTASPSETFTVDELAVLAYPSINAASKQHRVAVIRAADKVCRRTGWLCRRAEHPGGHLVFYNPHDVRSYALGKCRLRYLDARMSASELASCVDDPNHPKTEWYNTQPGGVWWRHVEIHKAELEGRESDATEMRAALNRDVLKLHNENELRQRLNQENARLA